MYLSIIFFILQFVSKTSKLWLYITWKLFSCITQFNELDVTDWIKTISTAILYCCLALFYISVQIIKKHFLHWQLKIYYGKCKTDIIHDEKIWISWKCFLTCRIIDRCIHLQITLEWTTNHKPRTDSSKFKEDL